MKEIYYVLMNNFMEQLCASKTYLFFFICDDRNLIIL